MEKLALLCILIRTILAASSELSLSVRSRWVRRPKHDKPASARTGTVSHPRHAQFLRR
jgi:hypothetical protein